MASESLIYRIKAIWQGGRATAEAAQDIQGVGKAGDKAEGGIKRFQKTAVLAGAAIAGAAYAAKEGWELLGEGADLIRIDEKFAAAAENIGTTADGLKRAILDATGGIISEAEATAGALELIDTGLASNQDEVVRLSRLVGELGWDMQALTLTMLNDSEKRLDTLGLSAERVAELEQKYLDLGMAHEQAFDIAVIEAGEEKLALYGSQAESIAGQMAKIESAWANVVDSTKRAATESAGPWIQSVSDLIDARRELARLEELGIIQHWEYVQTVEKGVLLGVDAIDEQVDAWGDVMRGAETADRLFANYVDTTEDATRATDQYSTSLQVLARQGRDAAQNQKWLNEHLRETAPIMAGDLMQAIQSGVAESENYNSVLFEQIVAVEQDAEALAAAAVATGEWTHQQAAAAIKAAVMADKAEELAGAVTSGEMSVWAAVSALEAFEAQVDDTQGDYYVRFHIQTIGGMPETTGPGQSGIPITAGQLGAPQLPENASGTNFFQGGLTWVGERGPELVALPRGSRIYSNEESRSMGGYTDNRTIINNYRSREAAALGLAMADMERRQRARDYMGVS